MHSVCRDLYKRDSPANVFMNQVDPDLVLSLCTAAQPPDDMMLFNPQKESTALLRDWLVYRGVQPAAEDSELAAQVTQDMEDKRNSPAIIGFTNFDVGSASKEFLRIWLSWFGVGSDVKQSLQWWQDRARHVQNLRLNSQERGSAHLRMQWKFLVESQQRTEQMVKFVVCSGTELARAEWKAKRLARQQTQGQDAVFAKYAEAEPLSAKQIKKRWQDHARDLKIVNYASQIDAKKLMSKALNMAVVALPLLIQSNGKLGPERIYAVGKGAKKAAQAALEAASSGDPNKIRDAFGKGVTAVKNGMDVNLLSTGLGLALSRSGLGRNASAILPLMLRQWNTGSIDPPELIEALSGADPSLLQLLVAQLALGVTGQTTQNSLVRRLMRINEAKSALKKAQRNKPKPQ